MKYRSLKVTDLNPDVPNEEIHELLLEKFTGFYDIKIRIVPQGGKRVAYVNFRNEDDAHEALMDNRCLSLCGYACRVMPVYQKSHPSGYAREGIGQDSELHWATRSKEKYLEHHCHSMEQHEHIKSGSREKESHEKDSRYNRYMPTKGPDIHPKPFHYISHKKKTLDGPPNHILYIGSLDIKVRKEDLQRLFKRYGYVLDVELKRSSTGACFAFVTFLNMDMARRAKEAMMGKHIGPTIPKLGYGTPAVSKILWVGGLGPWTSVELLQTEFSQFGEIQKIEWPEGRDYAYVVFESGLDAQDALKVMHGSMHGDPPHRLHIDFAEPKQMASKYNYLPVALSPRKCSSPSEHRFSPHTQHKEKRNSGEMRRVRKRSRSQMKSDESNKSQSSPYAENISLPSDDDDDWNSDISSISRGSRGSASKRRIKCKRSSTYTKSPDDIKHLRNPSPPLVFDAISRTSKDERTVVLKSQSQDVCVNSSLNVSLSMPYGPQIDPVTFFPLSSAVAPITYQPPPLPHPEFYISPCPNMPQIPPPVIHPIVYPQTVDSGKSHCGSVSQRALPSAASSIGAPVLTSGQILHSNQTTTRKHEVSTRFPKVWSGALVLKNGAFVVNMHLVSGSVTLVDRLLGSSCESGSASDCPVLKIAQRLRLDQPEKLEELDKRLKQAGRAGCTVLIACPTPAQVDDDANVIQQHPLQSLVSYLVQKQVAAVVPLPPGCGDHVKASGILHAFPPCQFASDFLKQEAADINDDCPSNDQLLVVICTS